MIYGGAGDDHLLGESTDWGEGTWNPTPYTPAGHDTIFGGPGNDWIEGNNGNDKLYGESGNDTILGGNGNDGAWGGGGNDTMGGGDGDDGLHGDEGDDTIEGNNGVNTITGGQGDDELIGGPERDILDGNEGNDLLGGGEHHALDTSGTNLQGHYVLLYLDFSRIADMVFDDRHVTVTMTDGFGMSMTEMRNLTASASYTGGTDGSVIFPIFEPDTNYSISTTLHGGLSGGYSGSFNSSGVEYRNGVYEIIVEILSTGVNRDEDGNLPEGYTPPNPDPVEYFPHDDGGFVTYGGGSVTIAPLANDVYSGNASIQIIGGGSLGTASLNGNGTVSYVAHAHTWGLDIIKYKLSQGGQTAPLIGAIYVQVARFKEPVINIRTTVEVTPQQLGKEPQAADFAAALQDHLIATEQGEHQNAIFSFSRDRNFRPALALAGYVIFWSKDHSNATNDLDLSGLKADVVPFFFVSSYKEKERAQKVSFIGVAELANAPQLAADHERWHTDGAKPVIPLAAYSQPDLVIEKRVGYGPGAKEGSAKLRNALALFISRAQPTAAELQAACDELFGIIFNGTDFLLLGEWHDEPFDQTIGLVDMTVYPWKGYKRRDPATGVWTSRLPAWYAEAGWVGKWVAGKLAQ